VQDWRRDDPAFVDLMTNAHEDAMDLLEEETRRRGHDGVVEPVYQGGRKVVTIRKYSDDLLMMFLKGKRRDSFSERVEQTGAGGSPLDPGSRDGQLASEHEAARATMSHFGER
jgi:hypothetical protein